MSLFMRNMLLKGELESITPNHTFLNEFISLSKLATKNSHDRLYKLYQIQIFPLTIVG